jgi:hypothetical protein
MIRLAVILAATVLTACHPRDLAGELRTDTHAVPLDNAELTRVEISMHAGEMRLSGGAGALMEGEFTYNVAAWKPRVEHRSTGTRSDLQIVQPPEGHIPAPDGKNRWEVRLNDTAFMDVVAKLGAGEAQLDLGSLNLRTVDLEIGVGEVRVDLRGTPRHSYDVHISGGVGQATVLLPAGVGINATATGGLGEIKMRGLLERNGRWINPRAENSPVVIRVDAKGGIGQIEMIAE